MKTIATGCLCAATAILAAVKPSVSHGQAAPSVLNDFNNSGASDLAVYHPATGHWFVRTLEGEILEWFRQWGYANAVAVPADYNGDGITDLAVYDRNGGFWYILTRDGQVLVWGIQWGWNTAVPVPGDYTGNGRADLGVYDLETGNWYVASIQNGAISGVIHWASNWGFKGDVRSWERPPTSTVLPMPFDYDRDGVIDRAIYYRGLSMTDSGWYIRGSTGAAWFPVIWGSSGSIPVPGMYRSIVNAALYPAGVATYKVKYSPPNDGTDGTFNTPYMHQFRIGTYARTLPVAAHDFDGNGWDDHAVYNYLTGEWIILLNHGDGNGAPPNGQTYLEPPRRTIAWGFHGAVPANIYSTIYTACRYSLTPW